MLEQSFEQTGTSGHKNRESFVTVEAFAALVGLSQQGISYHLNQGKLKPFVEQGLEIYREDRQYFINPDLARLFKGRKKMATPPTPVSGMAPSESLEIPTTETSAGLASLLTTVVTRMEQTYEKLVQTQDNLIQSEQEKNKILNREVEARNTAIIKHREQESRIEALETKIQALEAQLKAQHQQLEKPWWRRWL